MTHKFNVLGEGGDLYQYPPVVNLFCKNKYGVFPTEADSSFQTGPVERAHCTITTSTKALLFGGELDFKFCSYTFNHDIKIRNALPHQV